MLNSLKFCQGSVAKKDLVPALTHFVIEDGRVRGFNGVLALSSPIPFDVSCKPKADTLIRAISNCDETVQLALTKAGRLSIKSGGFKVFVDCVEGEPVHALPEGEFIEFDGELFYTGLKAVAPFVGNDASRRWANGVLVENGSLFATNNVMLVQYWLGMNFPSVVNIPREAVKEMLRIGEPPSHAQVTSNSITFHYSGERWLRTQLYDHSAWPDLGRILDKPSTQRPIEAGLFTALAAVKPFVDAQGLIIFGQQHIRTSNDPDNGAEHNVPELIGTEGRYNIQMLELLEGTAKTIDWTTYPAPCLFMNDRLRGAIIGLRP